MENLNNTSVIIENDIRELDLSYNEIKDSLESLGQLKNLMLLNLSSNSFHGPFPTFFGKFSTIRVLDLSENHLIGVIPDNIGELQNLRFLNLSGNNLTGVIPDGLWKLYNLIGLGLSSNSLVGTLKEINLDNLVYLQYLEIGNNNLSIKVSPHWLPPFQLKNLELHTCKIDMIFPQ